VVVFASLYAVATVVRTSFSSADPNGRKNHRCDAAPCVVLVNVTVSPLQIVVTSGNTPSATFGETRTSWNVVFKQPGKRISSSVVSK
jgi:hypothetical protein